MTASQPSARSRWIALVVLCAGMLMIVLDQTIVNVALPAIRDDLKFTDAGLAWVINAYLIAFGGLLLLAGRLGDLIGRKRIFLIGLTVFTLASLLCGASTTPEMLIVSRFLQGVGGAMATAVTLGMIVTMFPKPAEQARAIGVFSFVAAAGASIGLLLGGVLTQALNWHWIFLVNVPIGIAALVFATRLIANEPGVGLREGADVLGATLITGSLMLGVYSIVESQALLGVLAVVLLAGFIVRQLTAANPLLSLRIFRSRNITGANVVQILMIAGMFGMFFLGTLYMQFVLGYNALQIGLAFLPVALAIGTFSAGFSAPLMGRFGPKPLLIAGLTLVLAGLIWFAQVPVDGVYLRDMFPAMLLLGIGAGVSFPTLMTLAMSGATSSDAGLASGLVNTTAQVGGAVGLAVLATLSTTRTESLAATGVSAPVALTSGFQLAFWTGAALVAIGVVIAATVIRIVPATETSDEEAPERVLVHV
ncbi:MFS transporter [Catelliglobosispora koreensis]|uniref:MFS transporter n=1 Tax=Catelliglobosispora koreensis TaxID=129052 RepID=UPI000362435B|nr:MFS transporter [Catelliglobosispora koreensis]